MHNSRVKSGFTENTASLANTCNDYLVRHSGLTPAFTHLVTTGWMAVDGTVAHDHCTKHTIEGFDKINEDQRARSLMRSSPSCE